MLPLEGTGAGAKACCCLAGSQACDTGTVLNPQLDGPALVHAKPVSQLCSRLPA